MIDEGILLVTVIAGFFLLGLALVVGIPILIVKIFHLQVSLWTVSLVCVIAYLVGTYLFFIRPI